jgi:UPF0755 protein
MFKNRKNLAFLLVAVSTIVATLSFYFWQMSFSPNLNVDGKKDIILYIHKNASYQTVLDSLRKHKAINDEMAFGFLTKKMKYREHIKAGRYEIPPNSSNRAIVTKLRSGDQDPVRLTFNNVRIKEELVEKIGKKLLIDKNEVLQMLNDEEVCAKYGFNKETIMCMFLPDTYDIFWDVSAEDFFDRMHKEYKKFWNADRLEDAKAINMSPAEVGVMASIVQSETNAKDEMPRVAGVYVNRIAQNIHLDADPTVKFAVGDFTLRRILNKHLTIDSPYNTYRNAGLPPGPIALPERVAIDAVLGYEKHNYIFFCAKEDFSGHHNFAVTYAEHLKNADIYRKALDDRGIKK